jgi:hypothetical protein
MLLTPEVFNMYHIRKYFSIIGFLCLITTVNAQVFYRADKIDINTSFSEMAPVPYKNGLIFSSNRKSDVVVVTVDQTGNFLYNLYFSKYKGSKNFSAPSPFAKELTGRYNQSSACVSKDGNTLFYTATRNATGVIGDNLTGDTLKNGIFISKMANGSWLAPEEFPYNSDDFNVAYPSVSSDGKRLYFASEDPIGFGGYDLFYSEFVNNNWGKPVNLGSVVNTTENEVFPFILHDNRIFFASRGHAGEGGMDIFYSDIIDGKWAAPVNMPRPFNSRYDDFGLIANNEMDTGYFASNRKGSDDIYLFVSTFPSFKDCPLQVEEDFCYEFYESGTMSLDTTSLRYEWDLGDGKKIRDLRAQHCYAEPGFYIVQLNVIDTLTGEVSFSQASYDLLIEPVQQPFISAPDTVYVNETTLFGSEKSTIKNFKIENHYWDFGDGVFGDDPVVGHKYDKTGEHIVRLGLTGSDINKPDELQKACASKHIIVIKR